MVQNVSKKNYSYTHKYLLNVAIWGCWYFSWKTTISDRKLCSHPDLLLKVS